MRQAIFHVVTGRWITEIKENSVVLNHDPNNVPDELTQLFGETKLHGIISKFNKNRDKFVAKSFEEWETIPYKIG